MPYWFYKLSTHNQRINIEKLFLLILVIFVIFSFFYKLPQKIFTIKSNQYIGSTELNNVGNVKLDAEHEKRLNEINQFLSMRNQNETFLDLTNRGMHYLYFNKKIPVIYTSFYNSVSSQQALDSVEKLRKNIPDIILVYSRNILHDDIFPSIRINALYRWIFLNQKYEYQKFGENVFLVKTNKTPVYNQEQLDDLDYYFGAQNLKFLPEVWANSLKTLPLINVIRNHYIENYGKEIKIKFYEKEKVRNMDLLYLETNEKDLNFRIRINHSNSVIQCKSKSGKILIPMDNFPSWLLNDNLTEITIETNKLVSSADVSFYNRKYNHSL